MTLGEYICSLAVTAYEWPVGTCILSMSLSRTKRGDVFKYMMFTGHEFDSWICRVCSTDTLSSMVVVR